ncbi:hypothetical protein KFK09_002060 [Dendrobium nobile]|uniref:Uncharacterized protein n=1 Tax=Dendrobium nobile TaxID=94219 RepID=A0A8T3C972_DENNO|nr:hypothetical protein KFK09_002060 [Dendrobium nobile]
MVGINSLVPIVNNSGIPCVSPLVDFSWFIQEACEGIITENANKLLIMLGCDHKHIVVEKDSKEIVIGLCHDKLDGVNVGICDVNMVGLNDSPSGIIVASDESPLASLEDVLSQLEYATY